VDKSTILATIIAAIGGCLSAWVAAKLAHYFKETEKYENAAEAGLAAQIKGWESYTKTLENRIAFLEKQNQTQQEHISRCEKETAEQARRIAQLERRLGLINE
jgi:hypothetical protein